MSYKTFVKGKIIETTGGDYNIYAKENIVFTSAKTITEIGLENGVTYGEPKKAPAISKYKKIIRDNDYEKK